MNKKQFLQYDELLKSEIKIGLNLGENEIFGPTIHKISFQSCIILGMKSVACENKWLLKQYSDERDEYFNGIELILGTIYSGFSGLSEVEKIKMFNNTSFTPRTSKERFEAMKKIKEIMPKLRTSWIEMC